MVEIKQLLLVENNTHVLEKVFFQEKMNEMIISRWVCCFYIIFLYNSFFKAINEISKNSLHKFVYRQDDCLWSTDVEI